MKSFIFIIYFFALFLGAFPLSGKAFSKSEAHTTSPFEIISKDFIPFSPFTILTLSYEDIEQKQSANTLTIHLHNPSVDIIQAKTGQLLGRLKHTGIWTLVFSEQENYLQLMSKGIFHYGMALGPKASSLKPVFQAGCEMSLLIKGTFSQLKGSLEKFKAHEISFALLSGILAHTDEGLFTLAYSKASLIQKQDSRASNSLNHNERSLTFRYLFQEGPHAEIIIDGYYQLFDEGIQAFNALQALPIQLFDPVIANYMGQKLAQNPDNTFYSVVNGIIEKKSISEKAKQKIYQLFFSKANLLNAKQIRLSFPLTMSSTGQQKNQDFLLQFMQIFRQDWKL